MKKLVSTLAVGAGLLVAGAAYAGPPLTIDVTGDMDNFATASAVDAAPPQCPRIMAYLDSNGLPAAQRTGYDSSATNKSFVGKAFYYNSDSLWNILRLKVRVRALDAVQSPNDTITLYRWHAGMPGDVGTTEKVYEASIGSLVNAGEISPGGPKPWVPSAGAKTLGINLKPLLKARYSCFSVVVGNNTAVDFTVIEKQHPDGG